MIHNMCVIPARGGSKEIPRKNIKEIYEKPLIYWIIKEALKAETVSKLVVSTDDNEIGQIAEKHGAEVYWRSAQNCEDDVHAVHAIIECLNFYEKSGIIIDNVGMLLATSPLTLCSDIDNVFNMLGSTEYDSVVSVTGFEKPISSLRYLDLDKIMSPIIDVDIYETRRQDIKQQLYEVNGAIFAANVSHLKESKSFHEGNVKAYHMPRSRSIDINTLDDWTMADAMLRYRK